MIRVTIWNEFVQERLDQKEFAFTKSWTADEEGKRILTERAQEIRAVHGTGIHETLKKLVEEDEEFVVKHIATLDMEECGLTKEVLDDTDVLIWWAHIAHDQVPDEIAARVREYVWKGMGMIFLHSAHMCKPMQMLLGTSGTLRWREGDFCRIWTTSPAHPIAAGIPESIQLEEEEMYGEHFDIPNPDDQVFLSWYRGGEVFRSGCTWTRGMGRIFYFQPGHETNRSYFNEYVRKIIRNAVRWTANTETRRDKIECIHAVNSPESLLS